MNNSIKNIFKCGFLTVLILSATSCEDYLERSPDSIISEETAFQNFTNFQGFTEELYHCIPNFTLAYWVSAWNFGEDEIESTAGTFTVSYNFDRGNFWAWQEEQGGGVGWFDKGNASTTDGHHRKALWPLAWMGIRKANLGLENLYRLTDATDEERKFIEGQLLFFRGWFHFQLIQYFGGMPYIDTVLPSDEKLRLPRLTYKESADRITADLRRAADLLPLNWDDTTVGKNTIGKNTMRINKAMALGYLGKNLLWAASPLMNYTTTGNKSYDATYAKNAADVFGELLQLVETGQTIYSLMPFAQKSNLFYTTGQNWAMPGGTEAMFRAPTTGANGSNFQISKQFMPLLISQGDATMFMPTANYVHDNYGMANGLPLPDDITKADPESGYDPNYPWKGRDPRFYSDITYDGVKVIQGAIPDASEEQNRYANLFTNGSYRNLSNGSRTGYMSRKFVPLRANKYDNAYDWGASLHINVPYMRLADIYLMYAESVLMGYNSPSTPSATFSRTAIEAVNVIRDRAGMANVHSKFTGSVEDFLPELRRERAVELAFERHRFTDLRRWMLLIEAPYTIKTSVELDRVGDFNVDDPTENRVANIREVVILERPFSERHYWLPLKVSDVSLYPEMTQNPGW